VGQDLSRVSQKANNPFLMDDEAWAKEQEAHKEFFERHLGKNFAAGAAQGTLEFGEEFMSPVQLALAVGTFGESALARGAMKLGIKGAVPAARTMAKLLQAQFAAQMIEGAASGAEGAVKSAINGDWESAGKMAVETLASGLMAKGLIHHEEAIGRVRQDLEKVAREKYGAPEGKGIASILSSRFDSLDPYKQGEVIHAAVERSPEYKATLDKVEGDTAAARLRTKNQQQRRLNDYYGSAVQQAWDPNVAQRTIRRIQEARVRGGKMDAEKARKGAIADVIKTLKNAVEKRNKDLAAEEAARRQDSREKRTDKRQGAAEGRAQQSQAAKDLAEARKGVFDERQKGNEAPIEGALPQRDVDAVVDDNGQVTYPADVWGEQSHFGVAAGEGGHAIYRQTPRGVEWMDANGNFAAEPGDLFQAHDPETADTMARIASLSASADSMAEAEGATEDQKHEADTLAQIRRDLVDKSITPRDAQRKAGIAEKVKLGDQYDAARDGKLNGPYHESSPAEFLRKLEESMRNAGTEEATGWSEEDIKAVLDESSLLARQQTENNLHHVYRPGDYIVSKRGLKWTLDSKGLLHPSDGGGPIPLMKGGLYSNQAFQLAASGRIGYGTVTREQRRLDNAKRAEVAKGIRERQAEVDHEMTLAYQNTGLQDLPATGGERADEGEKSERRMKFLSRPPVSPEVQEARKKRRMEYKSSNDPDSVINHLAKQYGVTPDEVMRIALSGMEPKTAEAQIADLEVGDRISDPFRKDKPWMVEEKKGKLFLRSGQASPIELDRLNPSDRVRQIIERGEVTRDSQEWTEQEKKTAAFEKAYKVHQHFLVAEVKDRMEGKTVDPEPRNEEQAKVQAEAAEQRSNAAESVATEATIDALSPTTEDPEKAVNDVEKATDAVKVAEDAYAQQVEAQAKTIPPDPFPQRAPASIGHKGSAGTIVQNNREFQFHYEVLPIEAVQTSHSWNGVQMVTNEDYPEPLQPRTISEDEAKQNDQRATKEKYDFRQYSDKTINASMGPTIVDQGGRAVGGNTRMAILRRHLEYIDAIRDPEEKAARLAGLKAAMRQLATESGVVGYPDDDRMYVVVRMLDKPIETVREASELGRLFNKSVSVQITKAAKGVSYSKSFTEPLLEEIGKRVESADGVIPAMNADPEFFRQVVLDKFGIVPEEYAEWFDGSNPDKGLVLNKAGQDQFVKALLGTVVKDTSILNRIEGKTAYRALERALQYVLKMRALPEIDLTDKILDAIAASAETQGTDVEKHSSKDPWRATFRPEQQQLAGFETEIPPEPDRVTETLWRALHASDAAVPRTFNDRMKSFIADESSQGSMFGPAEPETPVEAFNRAFKKELREVALARGDKQEELTEAEFKAAISNREFSDEERQEVEDLKTKASRVMTMRKALLDATRETKLGTFQDPIAEDILKRSPEQLDELENALQGHGITELRPLSGGASSVVLEANDGKVVRLGLGDVAGRPKIPEMLPVEASGKVGGVRYEISPKITTSGVTEEHVNEMKRMLSAKGYELVDAGTDNLGFDKNGKLVVVDPGAVTKKAETKAGIPPPPKIETVASHETTPEEYAQYRKNLAARGITPETAGEKWGDYIAEEEAKGLSAAASEPSRQAQDVVSKKTGAVVRTLQSKWSDRLVNVAEMSDGKFIVQEVDAKTGTVLAQEAKIFPSLETAIKAAEGWTEEPKRGAPRAVTAKGADKEIAEAKATQGYVTPNQLLDFLQHHPSTADHAHEIMRTAQMMAEFVFDDDQPEGVNRKDALAWLLKERVAKVEAGELKNKRGEFVDPAIEKGFGAGILKLHKASDPTTFIHEFAHVIFPLLSNAHLKDIDTIGGMGKGVWDGKVGSLKGDTYRGLSEKLAHGLEKFLRDENPAGFTSEVKALLTKLKAIVRKVYLAFRNDPLSEFENTERSRAMFSKMFHISDFDVADTWREEVKKARAEEKKIPKPEDAPHPVVALAKEMGAKSVQESMSGHVEDEAGDRVDPKKPTAVLMYDSLEDAATYFTKIGYEGSKIPGAEIIKGEDGKWGIKFNIDKKLPTDVDYDPNALFQGGIPTDRFSADDPMTRDQRSEWFKKAVAENEKGHQEKLEPYRAAERQAIAELGENATPAAVAQRVWQIAGVENPLDKLYGRTPKPNQLSLFQDVPERHPGLKLEDLESRLKEMPSYMMMQRKLLELQIRNLKNEVRANHGIEERKPESSPELAKAALKEIKQGTTGLAGIGSGMADAMTQNLYQGLFDALKAGKDTFHGVKDPVLRRAKPAFDAGLIKGPEDLRKFENEGYPNGTGEKGANGVREAANGVPGVPHPPRVAGVPKPPKLGMSHDAATGGKRVGPKPPVSLAEVHPVNLEPLSGTRGEPVGTVKGEPFDHKAWTEGLKRSGLPESLPAPTVALSRETAEKLKFPGQKQSVQIALSALEQGDGVVLGNATGSGKTYLATGLIKEFQKDRPNARILYITKNAKLKAKSKGVAENTFGFNIDTDKPKDVAVTGVYAASYMGMMSDSIYKQMKWDLVVADESGEARNWFKPENQQGKLLMEVIRNSKKAVYMSATPFHSPSEYGYLEKLNLWPKGQFDKWIQGNFAHENVDGKIVARLDPAKQAKLRQQLIERGQFVSQAISYEGFSAHFGVVPVTDQMKRGLDRIKEGFARARAEFLKRGKKGLAEKVAAFEATYTKAFLERERLPQAIELAKKARENGWQVIVFSEHSADDLFRRERNEEEEASTYQQLDDAMGGQLSRIIPPFPNVYGELRAAFGSQIGDYSGRGNSEAERSKAVNEFLAGQTPMMYTTYAAGGIGVDMHDADFPDQGIKGGDKPRISLFLGPPYSGVLLEQAMGRTWRFGVKSNTISVFLASDAEPDIKLMTQKVGPRMRALRAAVLGERDSLASAMADYTDEDKVRARQDALAYAEGNEMKLTANDFNVRSKKRDVGIQDWSAIQFPPAETAKNKGMKYGEEVSGGSDWSSLFQDKFALYQPPTPEDIKGNNVVDGIANGVSTGAGLPEGVPVRNLDPADRDVVVGAASAVAAGEVGVPIERDKEAVARQSMQAQLNMPGDRNKWILTWPKGEKLGVWKYTGDPTDLTPVAAGEPGPELPKDIRTWYLGNMMSQEMGIKGITRQAKVPEVGDNIVRMNRSYQADYDINRSQFMLMASDIMGDNKLDPHDAKTMNELWDVVEGKWSSSNPAINKAAADLSDLMGIIFDDLGKADVKTKTPTGEFISFRKQQRDARYMPHRIDWNAKVEDPLTGEQHTLKDVMGKTFAEDKRARIIQALAEASGATSNQVVDYLNQHKPGMPILGHVHRARTINFPIIKKDWPTLLAYFDQAAEAVAIEKNFGGDRGKLDAEIAKIPSTNGRKQINSMFDAMLEPQDWSSRASKFYNMMIGFEAASKMTLSAAKVPYHLVHAPLSMGGRVMPFAKAIGRTLLHPQQVLENATYVGTLARHLSIVDLFKDPREGSGFVHEVFKKTMFNAFYRWGRTIAGESARIWMEQYAMHELGKGGHGEEEARRLLKDTMLIGDKAIDDAIANGKWAPEDLAKAQTGFANYTMFSDNSLQMPGLARLEVKPDSPYVFWRRAIRLTYALQSFSLKTTSLIREKLYDEIVLHGNYKPLAYFMIAYPIVGEMLRATSAGVRGGVQAGISGATGQQKRHDAWDKYFKDMEEVHKHPAIGFLKRYIDDITFGIAWDRTRRLADPLLELAEGENKKARTGWQYQLEDEIEQDIGAAWTTLVLKPLELMGQEGMIATGTKGSPEARHEKEEKKLIKYLLDEFPITHEIPAIQDWLKTNKKSTSHAPARF
jgi:hypothetical protein